MSSTTKEDILHQASRMLLSKGLNGFSLQELASSLNLKKASLFHHYSSKNALAVELYRFYQTSFEMWVTEHASYSPEKQIILYVEKLTSWICDKERVCPMSALSLEWKLVDPDLQGEIKKLHLLQKEWITKQFKLIQKEGKLRLPLTDAVLQSMALIQGSIQLARVTGEPDLAKKNMKSFLKVIKD